MERRENDNMPEASGLSHTTLSAAVNLVMPLAAQKTKTVPQQAVPYTIAAMIAAAAGPLALLGSFIQKRTEEQKRNAELRHKNEQDPEMIMSVSVVEGINPDAMLLAALLLSRAVDINGDDTGTVHYDFHFAPECIADAMRDFHKLTGRDAAAFLRPDALRVAQEAETRAQLAANGLLDKLRRGPETPQ